MFAKKPPGKTNKTEFLRNLAEAREVRRREKQRQHAVVIIQKMVRDFLVRRKYRENELNQLLFGFIEYNPEKQASLSLGNCLASTMFVHVQHFHAYYHRTKLQEDSADSRRLLLGVLNYNSASLLAENIKIDPSMNATSMHLLISVQLSAAFFNKDVNAAWMKLNQDLLVVVMKVPETPVLTTTDGIRLIISALNYLHLMTDYQSWKALQKNINELLLKTMLALNRSYSTHLGQHNLLKILKVDLWLRRWKCVDTLLKGDDHLMYATTSGIIDHVSCGHLDVQTAVDQ